MPDSPERNFRRKPSWVRNLVRALLICGGCVALLLPAWLPNRPEAPIEQGTVELIQAFLLAASAATVLGAASHAGAYRPICRILGISLLAAFVGEIEDFMSDILKVKFPEAWVIGIMLLLALITCLRHRQIVVQFMTNLGNHAGAGFIASALLILYVFNRVIGSAAFWKATLGGAFSPNVPKICKGYLELLACYLIFVGILGLSITLARRPESK